MGTTTALIYARPTIRGPQGGGGIVFVTHRQVAGLYATLLGATSTSVKKHKKPSSLHPIGYVNGDKSKPILIDEAWSRYFGLEIGGRKLGGSAYPTLPDVTNFILLAQNNAAAIKQIQDAQAQMIAANAQTLQALVEINQAAAVPGADQIPPPVLAPPETTPPLPQQPDFGDGAGGGGGGGDGGDGGAGGD